MPILSLADIGSPVVHAALDYWRSKCGVERLPSRRDIDPVEIPRLLPHILLSEIWQEPFLVRYRLTGTALVEIYGFDYTGSYQAAFLNGLGWNLVNVTIMTWLLLRSRRGPAFAPAE